MGVSGSGKTTVARRLAHALDWPMAEADEFHSPDNVAKVAAGVPLTDADHAPWLVAIRDWIDATDGHAVLTCSTRRRRYCDTLRGARSRVRFLQLDGTSETIRKRLASRTDHFMPISLLDSQVATLEGLDPSEDGVAVSIVGTSAEIVERALCRARPPACGTGGAEPGLKRPLTLVRDQRKRSQTNAGRLWLAQAKEMRWDSNVESMLGSSISIMKSPS